MGSSKTELGLHSNAEIDAHANASVKDVFGYEDVLSLRRQDGIPYADFEVND